MGEDWSLPILKKRPTLPRQLLLDGPLPCWLRWGLCLRPMAAAMERKKLIVSTLLFWSMRWVFNLGQMSSCVPAVQYNRVWPVEGSSQTEDVASECLYRCLWLVQEQLFV